MPVKSIQWKGNLGAGQMDDVFSPGIWSDCPWESIQAGTVNGVGYEWDFGTMNKTPATTEGNFGEWTQFASATGSINSFGGHGWTFGATADNEGVSIRSRATPFKINRSNYKLWFEAQIQTSTITDTKHNILLGLCEDSVFTAINPLTALGAIADLNMVGFRRTEAASGGGVMDTVYKASGVTAVTVQSGGVTLAANTDVKLGMVFEPAVDGQIQDPNFQGSKYNLFFYQNGIRLATSKLIPTAAGTDFPNSVFMGPFFAILDATGSTPGTTTLRRMRVAQLFQPSAFG